MALATRSRIRHRRRQCEDGTGCGRSIRDEAGCDSYSNRLRSDTQLPDGLDALRTEILDARAYSLFEDVVPVLTALREEGWRHVIVSNHVPGLAEIVASLGIRALFANVITSGLMGYEKPHARIFEEAVRCAIPGAPIWMIGDSPECDCHPVGAFGVNAILVRAAAPRFARHAADLWQAARLITGS